MNKKLLQNFLDNEGDFYFDPFLLIPVLLLLSTGFVMVLSTTLPLGDYYGLDPFNYFRRQILTVLLSACFFIPFYFIPIKKIQELSTTILFANLLLLVLVLIPGIGHTVNGATRWISIFGFYFQPSEWFKLTIIVYVASYIMRHEERVATTAMGFLRPFFIIIIVSFLLLLEPDFGSSVVLTITALGMLFFARVSLSRLFIWCFLSTGVLLILAFAEPYRLERLLTFLDPWADPLDSGWQLTQALIAFANGGWFGVGLGNSIQKYFYLPEVHTDFVFAVLGEELGMVGGAFLILLFSTLIIRLFYLGGKAIELGEKFLGYVVNGIGVSIASQFFLNISVNLGLLPTKGLPLPFVSYGNNNLMVSCISIGIALMVGSEVNRILKRGNDESR